jgi:hypothetical protein
VRKGCQFLSGTRARLICHSPYGILTLKDREAASAGKASPEHAAQAAVRSAQAGGGPHAPADRARPATTRCRSIGLFSAWRWAPKTCEPLHITAILFCSGGCEARRRPSLRDNRFIAWTCQRTNRVRRRNTGGDNDRRHHHLADTARHRPPPGVDARSARLDPRRRNLAAKAEEPAHPARPIGSTSSSSMRTLAISTPAELRQADHKAVIAWERFMRETEHAAASTIRRRLAALSSLYKHLVRHDHAARNPSSNPLG